MSKTHRAILASLVRPRGDGDDRVAAAAPPWITQATVNPLTGPSYWNAFNAVTRPGTNDGWAGGYKINWPNPYTDQFLLEHWNGTVRRPTTSGRSARQAIWPATPG